MFSLQCSNLAKFYGKNEVFRGLNFRLDRASCVGIQGPNGSGKSTLMKCLSGLLRPSEGEITWKINGKPVDNRQLRFHAGYAAPYITLYNELSVTENLSFLRRLRSGHAPGLAAFRTDHNEPFCPDLNGILELASLSDLAGRDFGTLSSGQQQRVRLASALVADPPILMLDEPGTNLDSDGIALVSALVSRHRQRGGLVFISSNREEELVLADDRIVLPVRIPSTEHSLP